MGYYSFLSLTGILSIFFLCGFLEHLTKHIKVSIRYLKLHLQLHSNYKKGESRKVLKMI